VEHDGQCYDAVGQVSTTQGRQLGWPAWEQTAHQTLLLRDPAALRSGRATRMSSGGTL
jgi:hypothetical protein